MSKFLSIILSFSLALTYVLPEKLPVKAEEELQVEKHSQNTIIDESGKYIAEEYSFRVLKPEFVEIEEEQIESPQKIVIKKPFSSTKLNSNVEKWRPLLEKYFPANQVDNALRIIECESKGNPNAISRTNDHGLMQIHNGLQIYGTRIYDPEFNIQIAYNNYYTKRGWKPWTCSRKLKIK